MRTGQTRMSASERGEHHELSTEEPHAVDVEGADLACATGVREVHVQTRGRRLRGGSGGRPGRRRVRRGRGLAAGAHVAGSPVDRHDLPSAERAGRITCPDDAGHEGVAEDPQRSAYPRGLFDFVVGVGRWGLRVQAYAFLLITDRYPPFGLD